MRRYDGSAHTNDLALAIATDVLGNVYVTGGSEDTMFDIGYCTIKYYSNVDTAWVRKYQGPQEGYDLAYSIAVDTSGNVYVTGFSDGSGTSEDYATIKYYSNGDTAWIRRYDGPGIGNDCAYAIAVDASGNPYVTGWSLGNGTDYDYATIKYYSNGDTAWVRRYNGSGNGDDRAFAIAVDTSGNPYVTGWSLGSGTDYDCATIKYYSNGDTAWVRRYEGPESGDDRGFAIAVDKPGNVYVTGRSWSSETAYDYVVMKYYPDGDTAWVRKYNGPGNFYDEGYGIAVDDSGNVYVTGWSLGNGTSYDYATIKYYSNGDTAWARRYNGTGNAADYPHAMVLDDSGNVYVTGESYGPGTGRDYATIKYYSNGDIAWAKRYNGPFKDDEAWDIAVAGPDNVYVTGLSWGEGPDYATIKYTRLRGDVNRDRKLTVADIVYMVNYLFKNGPPPDPLQIGDCNCDGEILISDVVYLINYLFKNGPAPVC